MLIYVLHKDRFYTFQLPKEISGNYVLTDYDDDNQIRNLLNVVEINKKWCIAPTKDISISCSGQEVKDVVALEEYRYYMLQYFNKENIILYVVPGCEQNIAIKKVQKDKKIIFGKDGNTDCILSFNDNLDRKFELTCTDKGWIFNNLNPQLPIFVNKKKCDSGLLNPFDTLFVFGYRFTLLNEKIIFNMPENFYKLANQSFTDEQPFYNKNVSSIDENIKDFYSNDEYLLKSPVFSKKVEEYEITITPPEQKETNKGSSVMSQIVPSALMSMTALVSAFFSFRSYTSGESNSENFITNIVMCAMMLLTGIVWPIIEVFAEKVKSIITERLRVLHYKRYIKRKRKELEGVINKEKLTLGFNSLSLEECNNAIIKRNSYLYSRSVESNNFLSISLGNGKVPSLIKFNYTKQDRIVENDKLIKEVEKLIDEFSFIDNVPFSLSLKDKRSLAIINSENNFESVIKSILLQLFTLHDYRSLKVVVLTDEISCLNQVKNDNHCWSNDRSIRFFATNNTEAENVSSELIRIFNKNALNEDDTLKDELVDYQTHYLIITDSIEKYKNLKIIEKIIHSKHNYGFSVIMFSDKVYNIPMGCCSFVEYNNESASYFESEMDANNVIKFNMQYMDDKVNYKKCIDLLSNIPIRIDDDSKGSLPDKLGFLEMYNVGRIEQLNIQNRWKNSSIINSLAAPIGVDSSNNILSLDVHETKHGPHGLIAGMTGSGKSEFIVTYILSLAINYSPEEVQFVLIDYKGGGLAGAFENRKTGVKLPHLVGTITNLDKSEMNRTLVSINSELQRRQKKFNEAKELLNIGSINIYKYQSLVREGSLKEPMSHLFIICDEFAELKEQQPDFMNELVSAARIGRSLGVHLILSTQKPSGVVDDQIWSNAKFKVCCKVQTSDDSNEMIRRPDAASLKDAGRFYLQVGYDEYFVLGQSGYSGVQYVPNDRVESKLDSNVEFINNTGESYKNVIKLEENVEKEEKLGEELTNILNYIVEEANKINYKNQQLWLDNISDRLMYYDLLKKYSDFKAKPFDIDPIVGEYDDPKSQSQGYVSLPITREGNVLLFGATGKGKTTFLSTFIYSTIISHTSVEVNFYILDFAAEKLRKFSRAPQVGEVLGINDRQKIVFLFHMIEAEITKRQKYYSNNGGDFSSDVKKGSSIFPNIVVVINGFDVFKETFEDLYQVTLPPITRSCSKYGINFVVSSTSSASVSYSIENNFSRKLMLNMGDPQEYLNYFPGSTPPLKNPGRGIMGFGDSYVEFQTSLVFDESEENDKLKYVINKLNESFKDRAKPIPTVPRRVSLDDLSGLEKELNYLPVGINTITAQYEFFDYSQKVSVISSSKSDVLNKYFASFVKLLSEVKNNNVIVLNGIDKILFNHDESIKYYDSSFIKIVNALNQNIIKLNGTESDLSYTVLIIGYDKIETYLETEKTKNASIVTLSDMILNTSNHNFKYVIFETPSNFNKLMNGSISEFVDNQLGIWIGDDYEEQECFEIERQYYEIPTSSDLMVVVNDSIPKFVKFPIVK